MENSIVGVFRKRIMLCNGLMEYPNTNKITMNDGAHCRVRSFMKMI